MSIVPVTFRIVVKPNNIFKDDPAFAAAERMKLEIVGKDVIREQQAVDQGVVVAMGPVCFKAYDCENPLVVGDSIVYAKHAGKEITDPDTKEKFVVINDEDVVVIYKKEA